MKITTLQRNSLQLTLSLRETEFIKGACFAKQNWAHPKLMMNFVLVYVDLYNIGNFMIKNMKLECKSSATAYL